jgi:hypothetical protein
MHNKKYNNKTQNFIQGLRPFSNSIPHGLKKILKKSGYNFNNIVDNWTKMVGKETSQACYPVKVKTSRNNINGTLILNVIHGKEIEVEYNKSEIISKINSFFGYNCIKQIKLRTTQQEKMKTKMKKNSKKFFKKLEKLENIELKKSLNQLIEAFNAKNNV